MEPSRTLVVTSPAHLPRDARAPQVGLFTFTTPELWCGIVVKSRVGQGDARLLRRPEFLLGTPAQADALARPADFVPLKGKTDVLLMGHARAPRTLRKASATLLVGDEVLPLELMAEEDSGRMPFAPPHLSLPGEVDHSMRPRNSYDPEATRFEHPMDYPWEHVQTAHPRLILPPLGEGARVNLTASLGDGTSLDLIDMCLPPFSPRVMIDPVQSGRPQFEVEMQLDTVVVDSGDNALELELTWRGMFQVYQGVQDVDRVLVGFASDAQMKSREEGWQFILRELPYGQFDHAWLYEDAREGTPPRALSPSEVKAARYRVWNYPMSPEPRLPLETLTTIEQTFAERREPRQDTLARHGLDEQFFAIEQRAWLEKRVRESNSDGAQAAVAENFTAARALPASAPTSGQKDHT